MSDDENPNKSTTSKAAGYYTPEHLDYFRSIKVRAGEEPNPDHEYYALANLNAHRQARWDVYEEGKARMREGKAQKPTVAELEARLPAGTHYRGVGFDQRADYIHQERLLEAASDKVRTAAQTAKRARAEFEHFLDGHHLDPRNQQLLQVALAGNAGMADMYRRMRTRHQRALLTLQQAEQDLTNLRANVTRVRQAIPKRVKKRMHEEMDDARVDAIQASAMPPAPRRADVDLHREEKGDVDPKENVDKLEDKTSVGRVSVKRFPEAFGAWDEMMQLKVDGRFRPSSELLDKIDVTSVKLERGEPVDDAEYKRYQLNIVRLYNDYQKQVVGKFVNTG